MSYKSVKYVFKVQPVKVILNSIFLFRVFRVHHIIKSGVVENKTAECSDL